MRHSDRSATRIFDNRWIGCHGIGRFATELYARLRNFTPLALTSKPASPQDPWVVGRHLRHVRPELFFTPGYNAPRRANCAFAFCLHDLNHLHVRESSSLLKRAYYEGVIRPALRAATVVFTVSEFSRAAVCEWARVSAERVVNVGNGISSAFTAAGPVPRFARSYFLYVGNQKPHKNFVRLLRAFSSADLQRDFMLISTGRATREIQKLIAQRGLAQHVRFVGEVSDEELAALYRGATALVLVSLHEGFGLPVIEAMSCGAPVLCSTTTALPEVAGGAALLVDATDVDAISAALQRLAVDRALRTLLSARGLTRAHAFSWNTTARRVERALAERTSAPPILTPTPYVEDRECESR